MIAKIRLHPIALYLFLSVPALTANSSASDFAESPKNSGFITYHLSTQHSINVNHVEYYIDKNKALTYEEIQQSDHAGSLAWNKTDKLNFGYIPFRVWLKFKVANPTTHSDWILEQQFPLIQYLHFYIKKASTVDHIWAGRARPFYERPIIHKNLLFPFKLAHDESAIIYLSYESAGPIMALPKLTSKDLSISETGHSLLLYGLYYGILIAMSVYNLFLFLGTRDLVYIFYVLYTVTFCLFHMCLSGIGYQYLWPKLVRWNHIAAFVLIPMSYFFIGIFTKLFLETKTHSSAADKILNAIIIAAGTLCLLPIIYYNYQVSKLIGHAMFLASFFLFAVSILCHRAGVRNVKYFITAFAGIFVANSIYAARAIGFVRDTFFTNHGIQIASTAEVFLFSLALVARIKRLQEEREKERSVATIAAEISHNIRSPLATLNAVIPLITDADESIRTLVRYATGSIRDLANQLLELRRSNEFKTKTKEQSKSNTVGCEFITGLVEQIISLKTIEYSNYDLIHYHPCESDPFLFVSINAIQFRSIISNLINNSVEALTEKGRIDVAIFASHETVSIEIRDNGMGMSQGKMAEILQHRSTSDKIKGNGLGLTHAVSCIESWGGSLEIESQIGSGTRVTLNFPRMSAPSWFESRLDLEPDTIVAVLDDDTSIHKIWDQRLLNHPELAQIRIEHFTDSNALKARIPELLRHKVLFLIDQELLRQEMTGTMFIIANRIQEHSILVTSRWDEQDVIQVSQTEGIRVLPKLLAGQIPISKRLSPELADLSQLDCILIDDDALVRFTWEASAKAECIRLRTFETVDEFNEISSYLRKSVRIYIDYYMKGISGMEVSKSLSEQGFTNLYLATGLAQQNVLDLSSMPWIRGIQDKDPYWRLTSNVNYDSHCPKRKRVAYHV